PIRATKTRIHGDLHLGQVLVVKDDFLVIDFEGAPAESMMERRNKHSPIRDVAGMLRSFDYAAWSALFGLATRDAEGYGRLRTFATASRELVQATCLDAYRPHIVGTSSWPDDETDRARALQLYLFDKVLYEITYEAASRPGWVKIPVLGLQALLDSPEPTK